MLDLRNCGRRADNEEIFYDGFLYIIRCTEKGYFGEYGEHEPQYAVEVKCLTPEYDEPWTLEDIAREYPDVRKVIFDDAIHGKVYNYGNHKDCEWELVGNTLGYA